MMGNVLLKLNAGGERMIDKAKSTSKVDGPVAQVMAHVVELEMATKESRNTFRGRGVTLISLNG